MNNLDLFSSTSPCSDCPFRSDIQFYLRKGRREGIIKALLEENSLFICHKTKDLALLKRRQCAGALIMLRREGLLWENWKLRYAASLGVFDEAKLNMDAPIMTVAEFLKGND